MAIYTSGDAHSYIRNVYVVVYYPGIHKAASGKAKDKHASTVVRYSKINLQEGTQPLLESHVELDEGNVHRCSHSDHYSNAASILLIMQVNNTLIKASLNKYMHCVPQNYSDVDCIGQ